MKVVKLICLVGFVSLSMMACKSKIEPNNLESRFFTDSIYSNSLSEYRKHKIYLPPKFNKDLNYPIIYATDGNSPITDKKEILDSLINGELIKPLIFVASFQNSKIADSTSTITGDGKKVYLSYRNFEYVDRKPERVEDSLLVDRFENHKSYFVDELITSIEKQYTQNLNKNDRYFYGVSNGSGFGVSLLNSNPSLIGTYICFSTFGGDIQSNFWHSDTKYPNLYLRYGSEEPFFLKDDAQYIQGKYAEFQSFIEIKTFEGGHHNKFWEIEFTNVISDIFKREK
ncbi:alpha/beta hydrolase-fold protein [Dokdonia sp. R86516]|uniref:alpha/beta hydrolase-fold protein n=1 Tax=Dokdonia sp. R86516 TaxID=3093856 RepID=UPI0037C7E768